MLAVAACWGGTLFGIDIGIVSRLPGVTSWGELR